MSALLNLVSYYKSTVTGTHVLKAIVYTTDGEKYERIGNFYAGKRRTVFTDGVAALPGRLECEDFDTGDDGVVAYSVGKRQTSLLNVDYS